MQILYIIVGVLSVWILVLTVLVVTMKLFFSKLGKDVGKDNLINLLETLTKFEKQNTAEITNLKKEIENVRSVDRFHIQNVGIVKFNPFEEVGGEHSFSLCLLDGHNTGVVFTGLHTRDRTRAYLKEIRKGKPLVELSKEESKALRMALDEKK